MGLSCNKEQAGKDQGSPASLGKATIHTVAEVAGVSAATVSRVLNNSPLVASHTRERVLRAIKATGFRAPNRLARALRTNRTGILGLVVENIVNPYYAVLARAVDDAAKEAGFVVIVTNDDGCEQVGVERLYTLASVNVDGILIAPGALEGKRREAAREIKAQGAAVIVLGDRLQEPEFDVIGVDLKQAAYDLCVHLLSLGHRQIGFVGPIAKTDRFLGYEEALSHWGLSPHRLGLSYVGTREDLAETLREQLPSYCNRRLTAIIGHSDFVALKILQVLQEMSMSIPEDISVAGFDNIPESLMTVPPLATVAIPYKTMAVAAVNTVQERLTGGISHRVVHQVHHAQLCLRDSVGPPKSFCKE